jgi:hypothetical protein
LGYSPEVQGFFYSGFKGNTTLIDILGTKLDLMKPQKNSVGGLVT